MSDFNVMVNGKLLNVFQSITVTTDFLQASSTADISIPAQPMGVPSLIKANDKIVLSYKDNTLINGFVDVINPVFSMNGINVAIKLRDMTGDLIDSTIDPGTVKPISGSVSLKQLLERYIDQLGVKMLVKNNVHNPISHFTEKDNITAQPGESYFDHMMKYAHKRGCIIRADGDGNLSIEQGAKTKFKTKLGIGVIESSNFKLNMSKRYYKYVLFGQPSQSFTDQTATNSTNVQAIAIDKGADWGATRKSRVYAFQSDTPLDKKSAQDRVNREANYRRSNSIKYSCTVAGIEPIQDPGKVWRTNHLVDIRDDAYSLSTTMMIGKVVFNVGMSKSTTQLELLTSDAFSLSVEKPEKEQKLIGPSDYTMTTAEALRRTSKQK